MTARPSRRFYFVLAEKLGMTVNALLASISSSEITEWMAFYELQADDGRAAQAKDLESDLIKAIGHSRHG